MKWKWCKNVCITTMARVARVKTNTSSMVRVMVMVKTWMIVMRRVQLPVLLKQVDRREKILETSLRPFVYHVSEPWAPFVMNAVPEICYLRLGSTRLKCYLSLCLFPSRLERTTLILLKPLCSWFPIVSIVSTCQLIGVFFFYAWWHLYSNISDFWDISNSSGLRRHSTKSLFFFLLEAQVSPLPVYYQ